MTRNTKKIDTGYRTLGFNKNCPHEYRTNQVHINSKGEERCPYCKELDDRIFYVCQYADHADLAFYHSPDKCPDRK